MLGLPTTFWFLWTGVLVNRVGSFVLVYLTLYLTGERNLSDSFAGLVGGLYGVGALCAGPVGGTLADRIGRRAVLLVATVVGAASMVQLSYAVTPVHIALSTLALGFFSELFRPAANASVVDLIPEEHRVRAFGYLYWAANLGFSAATILGGLLIHVGYRWLFWCDAATTLAFGLVVYVAVPESRPAPHHDERPDPLRPYRDPRLLRFLAAQFLVAMVFQQCSGSLSADIRDHGHLDDYGWLLSLNGILIVLLQPVSLHLLARAPRHLVLAGGTLLVGVGFGANVLGHSVAWYATSIAVWTLGEIIFTPVTPAVIGDLAPAHLRGAYQGALHAAFSVAAITGPLVGLPTLEHLGDRPLWIGCLGSCTLSALIHLTSGGYERHQLTGSEPARDGVRGG